MILQLRYLENADNLRWFEELIAYDMTFSIIQFMLLLR